MTYNRMQMMQQVYLALWHNLQYSAKIHLVAQKARCTMRMNLYLLFLLCKRSTQSLKEAEKHCTVDAIGQRTRPNSPAHTVKTFSAKHVLTDKSTQKGSLIKLVAGCELGGQNSRDCKSSKPHKQLIWAAAEQ